MKTFLESADLATARDNLGVYGKTDDRPAADVSLADAGGYFTGADVEEALQELGPLVDGISAEDVSVVDAEGYFTGADVEAALQELGPLLDDPAVITGGLSVGGNIDAAGHLLPHANNTYDLGSDALEWRNIWIDGTAYLDNLSALKVNGGTNITKITISTAAASGGSDGDLWLQRES